MQILFSFFEKNFKLSWIILIVTHAVNLFTANMPRLIIQNEQNKTPMYIRRNSLIFYCVQFCNKSSFNPGSLKFS